MPVSEGEKNMEYNPICFTGGKSSCLKEEVKYSHRIIQKMAPGKIEKELSFVSTFNFVPERYSVSDDLLAYLIKNETASIIFTNVIPAQQLKLSLKQKEVEKEKILNLFGKEL